MNKIEAIEYKILSAYMLCDIENIVNDYVKNGWILQGGISINATGYAQAVTRTTLRDI